MSDQARDEATSMVRSILTTAPGDADRDAATVTALLETIPGAFDRARQGLADVEAAKVVGLDEL